MLLPSRTSTLCHGSARSSVWRASVPRQPLQAVRAVTNNNNSDTSTELQELSVEVPTADARMCVRFTVVPTGPAQQAIVVESVAEGSSVAQTGVQRGMRLTAISDPVRRNEVWQLQDRPSIRYIRDVLRMRSSPFIEMRFSPATSELLTAMEAAGDALPLATGSSTSANSSADSSTAGRATSSGAVAAAAAADNETTSSLVSLSSLSSTEEGSTMAERLQQQFEQKQQASQAVVAFKQRQQRRKDYMEQVGQRKNGGLALILGASFLLPAVVILAVAYGSGYLDALYSNTMSNMR